MDMESLIRQPGEWLAGGGPHGEIVISSRARLARNVAGHPFAPRIAEEERARLAAGMRDALASTRGGEGLTYFALEDLAPLDRRLLVERHLVSREQEETGGARGVAVDREERLAIMINEEDHLRVQSLRAGFQVGEAFETAAAVEADLGNLIPLAFDEEFGYLTACPTNVGTGLRVSVMLHLPALVMTRHIEKVFRAVHDLKLAVRGLYGEGTEAHGEFYQISNQITTGRTESELVADLEATIHSIIDYETKAREKLMEAEPARVEDRIWRAWATLRHARLINSEEAMRLLSAVRLGIHLGTLRDVDVPTVNALFLHTQPAHLQHMTGKELESDERDRRRARYIRETLHGEADPARN